MAMTSHKHMNMSINEPADQSPGQSPRAPYLKVNDAFPHIELTDENGRPITLHTENGRPRLIVFYRGAFCNYCEGTYKTHLFLFCRLSLITTFRPHKQKV